MSKRKINKELEELEIKIQQIKRISDLVGAFENDLFTLEEKAITLYSALQKESNEYEEVASKDVSKLVFSIFGSLEQRIENEEKEALIAKLRYEECLYEIKTVKEELAKLTNTKNDYSSLLADYVELYNDKLKTILEKKGKNATAIKKTLAEIEKSQRNVCEIDEAIVIGTLIDENLAKIIKFIVSAEGWRVNAQYFNKEVSYENMGKQINAASEIIRDVVQLFRVFQFELRDVYEEKVVKEIDCFAEFTEIFFNALRNRPFPAHAPEFSDLIELTSQDMVDRIAGSLKSEIKQRKLISEVEPSLLVQISNTKGKLQNVLNELSKLEKQKMSELEELQVKITVLVTKS